MRMGRSHFPLYLLLVATLFLRAFVPAGWMPDVNRSDVIVAKVCNAAYRVVIPLDRKDKKPASGHHEAPCAFAGFAGDAPLPASAAPIPLAPPQVQQRVATLAPLVLERTARLLPPGRAPPVRA